jgi:hypothetical protein
MRFQSVLSVLILVFATCMAQVQAQTTLYWDGDGVSPQAGGAGTWDTTNARFSTSSAGTVDQIWNNANGDDAILDTASGVVALAGPITVHTITTTIGGYSIGNGNGVTTAANKINFTAGGGINTTQASGTTTLTAHLVGQTLTKTGTGRLELNNSSNAGDNKFILNAGALTAPAPSRFGAPGSLVQDFFTFNGGGLGTNTTTGYDLGANRGVTILADGAFLGSTSNTVITTIGAPIVGSSGGDLTITSGGPFTGNAHNVGGIWVLSNTANSFDGDVFISGTSG